MKNNNSRLIHMGISLGIALVIWLMLWAVADFTKSVPGLGTIVRVLGGSRDGYIQMLTIAGFILGLLELNAKEAFIDKQREGFNFNLLPTEDQLILTSDEIASIKLNVINLEKRGIGSLISSLIKKVCTQFRNEESVSDTLQVFDAQVNTSKEEMEGQLEIVRYLLQAISSLGFIGTVMGLSVAIGMGDQAKTEQGMAAITTNLNVAFDTTIVALLLGLILTYRYHSYLEQLDTFFSQTKSYILDNLISRIYKG